jgi:hypothetical protein
LQAPHVLRIVMHPHLLIELAIDEQSDEPTG